MNYVTTDKIVPVSPADYDEVTQVWEDSVRATHHFLSEEAILYFKPLIRNEYLKAVELYCVKNKAGVIKGFLGVAEGKIEMLFIKPSSIGKGIGKRLVQFALDNLKVTRVDVNEQNPSALGFYKHLGFRIINRSEVDGLGKPYPILHLALN